MGLLREGGNRSLPRKNGLAVTRYYLLATLIVVLFGSIVFARRLAPPDLRIAAQPTGTPTLESPSRPDAATMPGAFSAEGAWVLSALPACFDEQSRVSGPLALLRAKLPPASERIAAGTTLRAGGCTLLVGSHDLVVHRDGDRLRVPPEAALYRDGALYTLVARRGATVEIRRYELSASTPADGARAAAPHMIAAATAVIAR